MKPRPATRRPVPADLGAMAKVMCQKDLARHYRCGRDTMRRWLRDAGITAAPPVFSERKPTPADFPEMAAKMGRNQLALHYGISYNTIVRMLADAGLEAVKREPPPPVERRRTPPRQLRSYAGPKSAFTGRLQRDVSTEGEAADFLRRATRAAIYRCTETGRVPDCKTRLTHWRYGNVVLTAAELLERAKRRGFDPDAWRRVGLAIAGHAADLAHAR